MQNTRRLKSVFKKLQFFSEVKSKPVYSGSYGRIHFKEVLTWAKPLEFGEGLGNEGHFRVINCNSFLVNENIMGALSWIYCHHGQCVYACADSRVQLFEAPWIAAWQTPRTLEFFGQEYWNGVLFPTPGDLPDSGIEPASLASSRWHVDSLSLEPSEKCI